MALFGALGTAALGLVDTVTNNYFNKKAASRQNEYSWSMWNATNEYNSPKNQMARYAEAGLNPNLIYGQSNTTSQGSVPSVQPTRSNVSKSLMDYYAIQNLKEQNKNLIAQNRVAIAQAGYIKAQTASALLDLPLKEKKNEHREEVIRKTGIDPDTAGAASMPAQGATKISNILEGVERGMLNLLRHYFGD